MNLPKRYYGTAFGEDHIARLREILGLASLDQALYVAAMIHGMLYWCSKDYNARKSFPDIAQLKRRLERISVQAANLSRGLEDLSFSHQLMRKQGLYLQANDDGVVDVGSIIDHEKSRMEEMLSNLRLLSESAHLFASNDTHLRAVSSLPPASDAGRSPQAIWLWPLLFEIWEHSGRHVAKTAGGPFHRFVSFIHEVAGFPEPSASTLKDAILAWEKDGKPMKFTDGPPWRSDDED
jgi:hypothetical protein